MEVTVLHADKCLECNQIIWTQTDNRPANKSRPNLSCQCYCGVTAIKNESTIRGGGGSFTDEELISEVENAHNYEIDGIQVII